MKVLVAGWFSFELMGASAGDLIARDLVCRWLSEAGIHYDIAIARPFTDGIAWQNAEPSEYGAVIFVCGPFGNGPPLTEFLPRFSGLPLVGLNLTMLQSLEEWNPFDVLFERDSDRTVRPDLVFLADPPKSPVVGLILVHPQAEYGKRARHREANDAIARLIDSREMAIVQIDTRLDENQTGLRSPGEVESLISRMDAVITTRLHGMVMALKNGVPPLVVDPIEGGAKIFRQARVIGWEAVFTIDKLHQEDMRRSLDFCLSRKGRAACINLNQAAIATLTDLPKEFLRSLNALTKGKAE